MSINALRFGGIAASGALIVLALVIARVPAATEAQAQSLVGEQVLAQTQAEAAPLAFIVRFRGSGPIARAQAIAARGRVQQAQAQVEAQLRRQSAFAGLCFDRFTVGGAEVVLRTCRDVSGSEREAAQGVWLRRLRAMRAVEYADANAVASTNRRPG